MNKVIMMGRLTKEPEVRYGQNNSTVGKFSIAVDRKYKRDGQPDADFFNCTTFGKTAEFVEKYLHKGTKVVITGSLQNNNYTDKDGNKRYDVQILVDDVEFAESKSSSQVQEKKTDEFMAIPEGLDDELPFN